MTWDLDSLTHAGPIVLSESLALLVSVSLPDRRHAHLIHLASIPARSETCNCEYDYKIGGLKNKTQSYMDLIVVSPLNTYVQARKR
jgi:hypothetical protein